jgi:hypothetical protein
VKGGGKKISSIEMRKKFKLERLYKKKHKIRIFKDLKLKRRRKL